MKIIKMLLNENEIARITDGEFENILICNHHLAPNFSNWYDDCFHGIAHSRTFEQRFELVKQKQYFCYSKPSLKLVAEEIPD